MKHALPNNIASLLEQWDNLGFSCKAQAAEWRNQTIEGEKKWQQ